jgi:hypothetical protein
MRALLLTLLLSASLGAGGCFSYHVVTEAPLAGQAVTAELTEAGSTVVTPTVGPNAAQLGGSVVSSRGDTLVLSLSEVVTRDGQTYYLRGATVAITRADIGRLRARSFDKRRTIVATAVGVTVAGAIIAAVRFGGLFGGWDPGGGGNPAMVPP